MVYREESAGNNERIGQYSYIGDDGKTYTVKYSAGVNGFRYVLFLLQYFLKICFILPEFLVEIIFPAEVKLLLMPS